MSNVGVGVTEACLAEEAFTDPDAEKIPPNTRMMIAMKAIMRDILVQLYTSGITSLNWRFALRVAIDIQIHSSKFQGEYAILTPGATNKGRAEMSLPYIETKQYPVEMLTEDYYIKCAIEPIGVLMTYIDSPERTNLLVKNVTMTGLANDSAVASVNIKELWVQRDEVLVIRVNEDDVKDAIQNLPAKETLRIFLPRFVVQGTLSRGEDTRIGDMFEVLKGTWAAARNAQVFPLTSMKAQVFRQAPLVLINKHRIRFYEPL